jgi:Sec-independent protein translocase protein TatA
MTEWIVIAVVYLLVAGIFHVLGGIRAAGEALRQWGSAATTLRDECKSPGACA